MHGCSVDGCPNAHRARGLCSTHYNQAHATRTRYTITCVTCGAPHQSSRPDGHYCSDACKGAHYSATRATFCRFPLDYPAVVLRFRIRDERREARTVARYAAAFLCGWCGCSFTSWQPASTWCTQRCKSAAAKHRRRAREHGAPGSFTWAEVVRIWITIDKQCAYCREPSTDIEPDHVLALSRGGSNSITNIVPACHACNSGKRDLLLHEWTANRARRGLKPLTIDPRLTHLAISRTAA